MSDINNAAEQVDETEDIQEKPKRSLYDRIGQVALIIFIISSSYVAIRTTKILWGSEIEQEVKPCTDDPNLCQVNTYLWYHGDIIFSRLSWLNSHYVCSPRSKVDSIKKDQYARA